MGFNEDDFKEFLYGNFTDDFRSYTKAEISDSAKTSIINRHERSYGGRAVVGLPAGGCQRRQRRIRH